MGKAKRYYDPGATPFPRGKPHAKWFDPKALTNGEPIGNSRQQRRQRALLPFAEQCRMAQLMKFEVPELAGQVKATEHAAWIARWEARYAAR